VRDELTGRLSEARRVLNALPDLGDRPQQRPAPGPQGQPGQQPQQGQAPQQRPGATEEARVTRREPEGPPTVAQPVAGPQTGMQRAVGPQTAVQPAVGPQTGGQAPLRPTPPSTQPAVQQPESPSSERTQAIRPVHATGHEEGRPAVGPARGAGEARPAEEPAGRQDPPTLVQPAVGPRDTGDQAAVPGRR
jgi:hypothetical protein